MNREQKEQLIEKIEHDIKSDMIAQEEKKKIKRSECPYAELTVCGAVRIANKNIDKQINF